MFFIFSSKRVMIYLFYVSEMMQESKLTNFQQRHLEKTLRGNNVGASWKYKC